MGFLGISGKTWKKVGKIALKVAPIVAAPFTGGASLLALGAGTGAISGALGGGGWKGALMGGAMGAIPGGGGAGAAAGAAAKGVAKAGLKEIAKSIGKGAATNFVTGVGTGLATGQGVKSALTAGRDSAISGAGSAGPSGSFGQIAKTVGKTVAKNAAVSLGGQAAGKGLQKAGVPGGLAAQGGNVFSNYLGNKLTPPKGLVHVTNPYGGGGYVKPDDPRAQPGYQWSPTGIASQPRPAGGGGAAGNNFVSPSGQGQPPLRNYLPQQQQPAAPAGGGGGSWKDALLRAGTGALTGAMGGGGVKGALTGAQQAVTGGGQQGGGQQGGGQPGVMNYNSPAPGGGTGGGGWQLPTGGGSTEPTFPRGTGPILPRNATGGAAPQTAPPAGQQPPAKKEPPDPNRPPTWSEKWGPIITQAGGMVLGGYVGKKAQESAMKRSPEEQAALAGAQGAAKGAGQLGGELAQQGRDYLQKPGQYFQTLLSGNRAAQAQAIATPTAALTGIYRGAQRNLDQQGIRGAARDVAAGDLNRERASKIAGLTTGVQPYAAEQLAKMGSDTLSQAPGLFSTSGNIYGNLLTQGAHNREYARQEGADTAGAIGGLVRDAGEVVFKRPQAPGTPAPKDKPAQGGTPQAPPPSSLPVNQGSVPLGPGVPLGTPPPGPVRSGGVMGGVTFGTPPPKNPNPFNVTFGTPPKKNPNPFNIDFGAGGTGDFRG